MIYSKNGTFRNTSHHHEELRFLNKSYLIIVLILSFTYVAFDIFIFLKLLLLLMTLIITFIIYESKNIESNSKQLCCYGEC